MKLSQVELAQLDIYPRLRQGRFISIRRVLERDVWRKQLESDK